jgi:hypothetical protein
METNIKEKILAEAENLKAQLYRICEQNEFSKIDLDLALSKTRSIYDDLLCLEKGTLSEVPNSEEPEIKENKPKKEKKSPKAVPSLFDLKPEKEMELLSEIPDEPVEEAKAIPVTEPEKIAAPVMARPAVTAEPVITAPPAKSAEPAASKPSVKIKEEHVVADKLQGAQQTVHDLFSGFKAEKDLGTKLQYKPITNLKSAININDKVLFMKELFENNGEKYNEAVDAINGFSDLDEAMNYINSNFKWDSTKESFNKFLELVYRRFLITNPE